MKNSEVQTLFVCGCCKRSLPASAFYINKKTGLPGNYCKECRKTVSRNHRKNEKRSLAYDRESNYPVITSTEDPMLRRELILHALETVAASIERKRRKVRESEFEYEPDAESRSGSAFESGSELKSELELQLQLQSKSGPKPELELAD